MMGLALGMGLGVVARRGLWFRVVGDVMRSAIVENEAAFVLRVVSNRDWVDGEMRGYLGFDEKRAGS
jgi:hypothetical protein